MVERKRIYITVKTYPTISKKYAELVCTAGVLEDGSWVRLYPMPFRSLNDEQKYKKYTWIELDVEKNTSDFRPETYRPYGLDSIKVEAPKRKIDWAERKSIVFKNKKVFTNLPELNSSAKNSGMSLAVFKPTEVVDLICEKTNRDWNQDILDFLELASQQLSFFQTPEETEHEFNVVPKVPYKFSYRFKDDAGTLHTLMIEDWEIGMLYFNCLQRANGDESLAIANVRKKYFDDFSKRDLHFFLGTTKQFHNVAPQPFIIIGAFPIPAGLVEQMSLF
jgi:hypothetical protein